jgi:HSP20 family molecular chaperone IbpA
MRETRLEMMHNHVRAIHRALTGSDPPEPEARAPSAALTPELVTQRFAELEAVARSLPPIADRVAPFSFSPPLDVIGTEREVIVELGVPGVEHTDLDVAVLGNALVVSGALATDTPLDGRIYFHAEMPRGPFRREVPLPLPISGTPRIDVDKGVIRVRLAKASKTPLPKA